MTSKVYDVSVLLDVHKVNCPGVWLCPKGKVSLKVCLFGVSDFTKHVDPNFPLIFNERFHFQRKFRKANTLQELHKELGDSLLTMQLYQFPTETSQSVKLAVFISPIAYVLSPDHDLSRKKPSEVDLLFHPCKVFPGIIAPKAEVTAKLALVEKVEQTNSKANTTISSFPQEKRLRDDQKIIRQHPVCHTKNYYRCKCFRDRYDSERLEFCETSKGRNKAERPRSARKTAQPRRKISRRFKSCSSVYCDESSSDSNGEDLYEKHRGNKCVSDIIGAHCRCACTRETMNNGREISPPHSSEYSSSDYTDVNVNKEPTGQTQSPSGCQCFRKTRREIFENEMAKRKNGAAIKPALDDAYHQDKSGLREEGRRNDMTHEQRENESKPARSYDDSRRHDSMVLEKSTVDGRKWGVKAFHYHHPASVR